MDQLHLHVRLKLDNTGLSGGNDKDQAFSSSIGDRRQRRVRAPVVAGDQHGGGVQAQRLQRRLDGHLRQGLRFLVLPFRGT